MTSVEIAGLILGVLPLIISAVEHYDDALRPLKGYRNFSTKVRRLNDELEVQRTIFPTECLLLLAPSVTRDIAAAMLDNPEHESRKSHDLEARLDRQFGSLSSSCKTVMVRIQHLVKEIAAKVDELIAIDALPASNASLIDKLWRKKFSAKLKFGFSETGLHQLVKDLSKCNKIFSALSSQIDRLQRVRVYPAEPREPETQDHIEALQTIQAIRAKSVALHDFLCQACNAHPEHMASLKLPIDLTVQNTGSLIQRIHFLLAFREMPTPSDLVKPSSDPTDTGSLRRTWLESIALIEASKSHSPSGIANVSTSGSPQSAQNTPSRVKGSSRNDLCTFLNAFPGAGSDTQRNSELPVDLHRTGLQLRIAGEAPIQTNLAELVSLATFLQSKASSSSPSQKGRVRTMPTWRRLRLAKSLALGVLELHTTPWLTVPLNSTNVRICDSNNDNGPRGLQVLVDVHIPPHKAQAAEPVKPAAEYTSLIRNQFLFHLGIVFLEIAYGEPFHSLQLDHFENGGGILPSIQPSADDANREIYVARYLAEKVGADMGVDYATITRQLLDCDFGFGRDLNSVELQARVYNDVVCRLERLENAFRLLQCGY